MIQKELDELNNYFKSIEKKSLSIPEVPKNKYLCIRLDGFKATKTYLKDTLINNEFNQNLEDSYKELFLSFRNYFTREYSSSIICSFIVNDEISIILNKDNINDGHRLMKVSTLFSSCLGSNMSIKYKNKTIIFDARPLILSQCNISKYIRYRYLISLRYAYWKVLRLNKYKDVYEDEIKYNIDNSIFAVKEIKREKEVNQLINTFKFCLTKKGRKPRFNILNVDKNNMSFSTLKNSITNYLKYLHNTKMI